MYPYTTPYHRFKLPIPVSALQKIYITYAIDGTTLFEKDLSDCETVGDDCIRVHLEQGDTGAIGNNGNMVEVQITLLTTDNERMTSKIIKLSSGKVLKGGEI